MVSNQVRRCKSCEVTQANCLAEAYLSKSPLLSSGCASVRRNHLRLVSWYQLAQPRLWSVDGRSQRKLQDTQPTGNKMVPQEDHTGVLCTSFIQFHYLTDGSDLFSLSIVFKRCLKQNQVIVGPVKRRRQGR